MTVGSSSISGTAFRDFDDDAAIDVGTDTGVDGVLMTLTGTDKDGNVTPHHHHLRWRSLYLRSAARGELHRHARPDHRTSVDRRDELQALMVER